MINQIDAILIGLPGVRVDKIGTLWRINVANLVGARTDGVSLAYDLRAQYEQSQKAIVQHADEIESLGITPAYVVRNVEIIEPEPVKVPPALADLIRENEPYGEAQARLWSLYVGLQNKLMLGLANDADARLHTRLHSHLSWISRGAAEVVK